MTKMSDQSQQDALTLADQIEQLASDAAQLHGNMRAAGVWGTGVTQGLERKLDQMADTLRQLVRSAQPTTPREPDLADRLGTTSMWNTR